ncbi:PLP-dependent aminotransferase family protein [Fulvimonas sp. R45]|uniref:MocR-like pyridoxine biosynthesis transcription factor PdxR n=1 Tax=Fulvimonas sp. R45 TaxID=3045937 RepID=UPI00265ED9BA|nr:PLP-dependent aminotransferase family protein [Fulvimonas sp. R45]MDO1529291.1 PLP-dependent aminotransferase family protein [Fulvimonas sp. R45]
MFLELDGKGPQYAQLARALQAAIREGRLARGARLPPTRLLARDLAVSRTTVLAAYEQLRAEGHIEGRVGSGSYVAAAPAAAQQETPATEIDPPSRYARRSRRLQHLLPAGPRHDMRYNLQYAHPLINPSLNEIWGRELAHAAAHNALEDVDPQGLPALRQQICEHLARWRGLVVGPQDVLVTHGAQQAFSLAARVLLDEGDVAVMDEPHHFGVHHALATHGADLRAIPVDAGGLRCDDLPATPPRLICVAPSHPFHGAAMAPARREALLRYADDHQCWILEDDVDAEFRSGTHSSPPLRAAAGAGRVIHVGSFSRTLLPCARVGYAVLPAALRRDFATAKYLDDFACPAIQQAALAHFMESGGFERHLRLARKELQARRAVVLEGLRRHTGRQLEVVDSSAGMYVLAWLRGHDQAFCEALIAYARSRGLGLHPVAPHCAHPPARPGLLLGFASLSCAALREAMQLLGQCLEETRPAPPALARAWCGAARFAVS